MIALSFGSLDEGLMSPGAARPAPPDQNPPGHLTTSNLDWDALHSLQYLRFVPLWWVVRGAVLTSACWWSVERKSRRADFRAVMVAVVGLERVRVWDDSILCALQ